MSLIMQSAAMTGRCYISHIVKRIYAKRDFIKFPMTCISRRPNLVSPLMPVAHTTVRRWFLIHKNMSERARQLTPLIYQLSRRIPVQFEAISTRLKEMQDANSCQDPPGGCAWERGEWSGGI